MTTIIEFLQCHAVVTSEAGGINIQEMEGLDSKIKWNQDFYMDRMSFLSLN